MSNEILINVTPSETRVAVVENGLLQEIHIERANKRGMVGNIIKGRVKRVLPGIQAAFVDIGLERTAFLHAADIYPQRAKPDSDEDEERSSVENIAMLVREGEEVVVQVVKDPLGTKGARLTTQISLASRYAVFMPHMDNVGISQKIEDEDERERLRKIIDESVERFGQAGVDDQTGQAGYIVRTAAEGVAAEDLQTDIHFLHRLWLSVRDSIESGSAVSTSHFALPLEQRILRDFPCSSIDEVRVDSRESCQRVLAFCETFVPELSGKISHYPGERPIFDLFSVDDEIQKALQSKVPLKSGGHLNIDQTESMTTIDVNTGAFVGHRNLEETIFKTNLEASQAIARQLRLRNLGGIIIIDFIDMKDGEHKRQVLRTLKKSLLPDRAKHFICEVSPLGLVEMTRERTRESLEHVLCQPCPICQGQGSIKTKESICYEIFREIMREARQFEAQKFLVLASPDVVAMLLEDESDSLAELESFIGKPVRLQVEEFYSQEQYDVVMV